MNFLLFIYMAVMTNGRRGLPLFDYLTVKQANGVPTRLLVFLCAMVPVGQLAVGGYLLAEHMNKSNELFVLLFLAVSALDAWFAFNGWAKLISFVDYKNQTLKHIRRMFKDFDVINIPSVIDIDIGVKYFGSEEFPKFARIYKDKEKVERYVCLLASPLTDRCHATEFVQALMESGPVLEELPWSTTYMTPEFSGLPRPDLTRYKSAITLLEDESKEESFPVVVHLVDVVGPVENSVLLSFARITVRMSLDGYCKNLGISRNSED